MAFGKVQASTDSAEVKRYIGVANVFVMDVNPDKKKLEEIYGREFENEPVYITEVENADGKKIPQVRIDFIVKADPNYKNQPENFIQRVMLSLRKEYKRGSNTGKYQIIDKYGRTAWATKEEIDAKKIPMYSNGPANIDADYRVAYVGEEDLTNFLKEYLCIPSVDLWKNGQRVGLIPNPQDAEARLEHIEDYFKGDISEIKDIIKLLPENKVKVLFGVRNTEDGRQFQSAYTRMFLKSRVSDYSRLAANVKATQDSGAMANTEFKCVDLEEYKVEATDFSNPASEMPFPAAQSPWGN